MSKKMYFAARLILIAIFFSAGRELAFAQELGLENPLVDFRARQLELSTLSTSGRRNFCRPITDAPALEANLDREQKMVGADIQRAEVNSQNFMVHIHQLIASYMLGDGGAKNKLYEAMTRAAGMDAFTVAKPFQASGDPDYNRWNEPLVHQAVALTAIAQAYTLLALEFGADDQGVLAVKAWGNHLMTASDDGRDDFKGRLKGRDRAAMKAAGYAWWGHATGNEAALAKAEKLLELAMSDVKTDGSDPTWSKVQGKKDYVYYMNMEVGAVVVAAFALQRAGRADIFERPMGRGATVEKAAQFVANMAFKEGNEIARKRSSWGTRGLAWLEFYFHQYPYSPDAANLRAQLAAANLSALYTGMLGGHTTCLVRRL